MELRAPVYPQQVQAATALCFLLPLALYALTAARTVQGGDAGEFGVVAALGGVAHPPGYPIYVLLARLAGHLPFGPIYWRIAFASAMCGAAASAVLLRVCVRLTGSLPASVFATLAFSLSPIEWRLSGVPEVFSLHSLICATAILCSLRLAEAFEEVQIGRRSAVLGLVLGLGMANHQTIVLLAPFVLWALWSSWRRLRRLPFANCVFLFVVSGAIGLAPYALLMHDARSAPEHAMVWGRVETFAGLVDHVLRRDYGTFQLASGKAAGATDPARHLFHFFHNLPGYYAYGFFIAGLVGVAIGLRRHRGLTISLLGSMALCLLFLSIFNLTDTPTHREVVERFHLMPTLLLTPFVALGLAELHLRGLRWTLMTASAIVLLAGGGIAAWPSVDWARDSSIERFALAEVDATDDNSVVLGRGDTEGAAILWVTQVLHHRPDVRYVDVNLLTRPWYLDRVRQSLPAFQVPPLVGTSYVDRFVNAMIPFASTYVIPSLSLDAVTNAVLEPQGFLDQVVPLGRPPVPLPQVEARLRAATAILGPQPPPVDAWAEEMHIAAGYKWLKLADDLRKQGEPETAAGCTTEAHSLLPPNWSE